MKYFVFLAALGLDPLVFACLNSPTMNSEHSLSGSTSNGHRFYNHLLTAKERQPSAKAPRLSARADPQDIAATTILNGDYDKAISYLTNLESANPGDYNTAANLGTAYELAGDNAQALHWIKEGIQRNPQSHQGTEWLHVMILSAKLAVEKGEIMADTSRLIPLPDTIEADSILNIHGESHKASHVLGALAYQLQERMTFVKPKERWVAECLYSLAVLQAHLYSTDDALDILSLAKSYGFPDSNALAAQRSRFERSIWLATIRSWTVIGVGSLAGIGALVFCCRKFSELLSS